MSENDEDSDNCRARIELAKLDYNDLVQPCQRLKFREDASDQEVTLLQLDKDVLNYIEAGNSLVIRGNKDDSAVLCTEDATYDVKNAFTSNTLILLDDCLVKEADFSPYTKEQMSGEEPIKFVSKKAVGWKFNYLEIKRIHPLTSRLHSLLRLAPFKGHEEEKHSNDENKYSLAELRNVVQASEIEIMECLSKLDCCYIDGKWRLLDFEFICECMEEIFRLIDAESWSCSKIPVDEMCAKINDSGELVPNFIVKHLLSAYGSITTSEEEIEYCKLDDRKICQFCAEVLLRPVGKFHLAEFLESWEDSLPAGVKADEKYLQGLALIDRTSEQPAVKLFKVEDLPLDMEARFDVLFQTREKWKLEDITPYIEAICMPGQTVSSMLTKYSRASTLSGEKLFCTRKPLK